jgi:Alcohol dehydrogenase, class IV
MDFTYYLPVNLIFGRGTVNGVGKITAQYGKKALLVTGKNSTKKTGLLQKTTALLEQAGVQPVVFDKVTQNPLTTTVEEGAALAKDTGCDVVLGLGGGSIMDAAKAIAFSALNPGDVSDFIFGIKQGAEALPIVLVPTTCGTGSEGNGFAVLTNPVTKDKKSLRTNCIIAKASVIDPELMTTMPKSILASVGFDAFAHNMESYLSKTAQPLTEMQAYYGMKLLAENLTKVYSDPGNMEAWEKVTLASTLGGMVINMTGCTAPHGMEHPASGLRDIVHGRGLAALTPEITRRSWSCAPQKYAEISRLFGGTGAEDCADRITELLERIDLRITLGEQGIAEKDIDWMAENCQKVSAAALEHHPRVFTPEEVRDIYYHTL